ncbi:hypothetical protein [Paenarthrobacter nitroguajacolicus]|uniref:hypothetical protein n=1 Tax=Paenarthrobacter nitroguajacolicus TaxID=211146 RepID=UPI0028623CED|nr:hypothetical protein [Paenarthrobacter nitroguajacolicus]MDR6639613.1 hypothetical protein [Paenarthrobacter nitroguajacolicus]
MNKKNRIVENSLAGAIGGLVGTLIGAAVIAYFVAIWTGTISGPQNPAFWRDVAPLGVVVVVIVLLIVPQTRGLMVRGLNLVKRLATWISGIRFYDKPRQDALVSRGRQEALEEVAKRNATPTAFNICYLPDSPLDGDWFSLTDFSGISGKGPMKKIYISAPADEIQISEKDGPTIPGANPDEPYDFSGRVTDKGHLYGINFRVLSKDKDGYPRCDFYRVPPTGQPLKGVPKGSFGDVSYGELITSINMGDGSRNVAWASTGQVMGRLVPDGKAWKVEAGRQEGRLRPEFMVEDELGLARTEADGVEQLRRYAEEDVEKA